MGGGVGGGSTFVVGGALSSFKSAQQFLFQTTKGWEGVCNVVHYYVTTSSLGQVAGK